jgi:colanic acid biosynthesis glycosyl transferase WcaI
MSRIFFINRYFAPDHSATSQMLSPLAFDLADAGRSVHVVTSRQRYDDPNAHLPAEETLHGVVVHRVSSTQFGRGRLFSRGFDYVSFYAAAYRLLLSQVRSGDVVIPKTDPPLLSILGAHVARKRNAILINWLQDIYPEVASELGVPLVKGPIKYLLIQVRNWSLRRAQVNVVVGDRMADVVSKLGVKKNRVHVIPNWASDDEITPVPAKQNPLRKQWKLTGKFVIGYSGNLGRAHEYNTLLSAAEALRDDHRFVFLFIGGGHRMSELVELVQERGLTGSFIFLPYQSDDILKYSLSVPDVHWISLRPEMEGLIVPSKFYGIAAAGRPIIAVTAKTGEIARLVSAHGCGLVVEPGDTQGLIRAILCLSENPQRKTAMGRKARQMLDAHFTRRNALDKWRALIDQFVDTESPSVATQSVGHSRLKEKP